LISFRLAFQERCRQVDYSHKTTAQLTTDLEVLKQIEGSIRRQKLESIAELQRRRVWRDDGAKDMAQWVAARCDECRWRSRRWVDAAQAIEGLPEIRRALSRGALSLDKVCELTRFATPETEVGLVAWARGSLWGRSRRGPTRRRSIRSRRSKPTTTPARFSGGTRTTAGCTWRASCQPIRVRPWSRRSSGSRTGCRLIPTRSASTLDARRADALVALSSQAIADDPDSARARVNLHVDLAALTARSGSRVLESGGIVHPQLASLLCCDSIVQSVIHGDGGHTVGIGWASRNVPEWLHRQLRLRDGGCTFPGCHHKRYVKAHHIWWWEWGGPTNLDNLVYVCEFHHKLIHVHGWRVELGKRAGVVYWFKPNYEPYEPNRAPPETPGRDGLTGSIEQRELVGA
jgi:hypothetical protein